MSDGNSAVEDELQRLAWPAQRLEEAVRTLAQASGLSPARAAQPHASQLARQDATRVDEAARALGLDAEPVFTTGSELHEALGRAAPALLRLPASDGGAPSYLLLARARDGRALLVAPDRTARVEVALDPLADALLAPDAAVLADVQALVASFGAGASAARAKLERALLRDRLGGVRIEIGFLLRPAAGAGPSRHFGRGGLLLRATTLAAAHFGSYALGLLAWFAIGRATFQGRVDRGLLLGWALLLASQLPLGWLAQHLAARLSVDVGAFLKRRLFAGALSQDADAVRTLGVGTLLGQVLEAEAVESLALSGTLAGVLAVVELAMSVWVLSNGAAALVLAPGLALCALGALGLGVRYGFTRVAWSDARRSASAGLIERMVGYRTRLVQERPERFHTDEDAEVALAFENGAHMDRAYVHLAALPRVWLVLALATIGLAWSAGDQSAPGLAVALGGALLGHGALARMVASLPSLAGAVVALHSIAALYGGARASALPGVRERPPVPEPGELLVEAKGLVFSQPGRPKPVLSDCSLEVRNGERILLEGASGGGKSTLASLLCGLREPAGGLVLYRGLDRHVLGNAAITAHVAAAPQFHDNHVLTGPLAFNLLMGRAWPPRPGDLDRATRLCERLGLGPLLERMPSGMMQMVGETGWQLSHGERSRVFMARALLQEADLTILDESMAALDPVTARQALTTADEHTRALLLIAHP